MPKVSPIQPSFSSGELSPLLYGRVDSDRYKTGLSICKNFIPTVQGGLPRRSGTVFVSEIKDSVSKARLYPFEFSVTQAYMLEFTDQCIRFYKDNGLIISGTPVEVTTPYLEADLFELKFTQSLDVLYITHPDYEPAKLTRTSHVNWSLDVIDFIDGPFLPINTDATNTMAVSALTGSVTVTMTQNTFVSTDVGRYIRIKHASSWSWLEITAYTSATQVTATVRGDPVGSTAATADWRLGVWSETTGYPASCVFHEDRLFFGGPRDYSQRIDGSSSGDYENFSPTEPDSTVIDSNAVSFSFNANDVNANRWLTSDERGLLAGTVGGEWVVRPSAQSEALSPTNITAKRATSYGSENVQPVQSGKATIFVQRGGRQIRELAYFYDVDGFRGTNVTELSEHITETGIVQMAHQKTPQSIVWCVRNDGVLLGMTYDRTVDTLKVGWSRHVIGGYSDAVNSAAIVESVGVIPSADGTRDELWLVVRRLIDGVMVRYVEYMEKIFDDSTEQKDAFCVDSGLSYDVPKTITNITGTTTVTVTSPSHGFSNGNRVLISKVKGLTDSEGISLVNTESFIIGSAALNTFVLVGADATDYSAYVSGGEVRRYVSTVSGLSHLEGQVVDILGDGAVQPQQTVSSGSITLAQEATTVQVGLGYSSDGQMLRLEVGAADGTALGKTRRTHRVGILFHRSLGLNIGTDFDRLDPVVFRETSDPLTRAVPLFSGIVSQTIEANYDFENQITWRQTQPLPVMILAVMPQMVTQDRG